MKAYISGALSAVKDLEQARLLYEDLGRVCERHGYETYVPHLHGDPVKNANLTPQEIFHMDWDQVASVDLIVVDITRPSTGVGAELGMILAGGTSNIVALCKKDIKPSRFIVGMLEHFEFPLYYYETELQAAEMLNDHLMAAIVA